MIAADNLSFLGRRYDLSSHNQKKSPMWEFTTGAETVNNWTSLITLIDCPQATTRKHLDVVAENILQTYKSQGGRVLLAKTMAATGNPFNYIVVAFDQPAQKRFELNFVKLAMAEKNVVVAVYGVRIYDSVNYAEKAKAFLNANSADIGKALETASFPSTGLLPRREF